MAIFMPLLRNRLLPLLGVLLTSSLLSAPLQAAGKIEIAAFEYPPIYQDKTDKGLAGDLVVAAFKAAGVDAELKFYPVARMVNTVAEGGAYCAIGGTVLFEPPDVARSLNVAGLVLYVSQVFIYDAREHPEGISYSRLEDMGRYRIGLLKSSGVMKILEKARGLNLEPTGTHESSANQLKQGRIDVWAIVDLTGEMYLKQLFPEEARFFKRTKAFNRGDVSLACSRKLDPGNEYSARFREGLARIKANGTYMQIMARYYGGKTLINKDALPEDVH
jgi:ABC-type amino acid transport substrate-binding protein